MTAFLMIVRPFFAAQSALVLSALLLLGGCQGMFDGLDGKAQAPIPKQLVSRMKSMGMTPASPIMLRIFKEENALEVWKRRNTGRYALLESFEICKWSGKLGPKFKEGDRQAPEGFYHVNRHLMNPKSDYHLAFNIGYPNAFDRAHGRTGSHLMVHGACSSAGCYSMTDERVEEIYALAREAFNGGQKAFQIQAYPFRMTAENMVKHRNSEHFEFWNMLKRGYDHFELTKVPPKVDVCEKRYEFNTVSSQRYPSSGTCPAREMPQTLAFAYVDKQNTFNRKFERLMARADGRQPIEPRRVTYTDVLPGVTITPKKPAAPSATQNETSPATGNRKALLRPAG